MLVCTGSATLPTVPSAMAALTVTFMAVIVMNVALIQNMTGVQSDRIGNIRLDLIRGDLEDVISDAQTSLLRVAVGAEQLLDTNASLDDYALYFNRQKKSLQDDESFMNVYIAGRGWHITPDFIAPRDFHAEGRVWYLGAAEHPGEIFITEPYLDADT